MNDKVYAELAARNSATAVKQGEVTRDELTKRIVHLENAVNSLTQQFQLLTQKYHLLLTDRFNGGPTA